jgi:hypothetical protein
MIEMVLRVDLAGSGGDWRSEFQNGILAGGGECGSGLGRSDCGRGLAFNGINDALGGLGPLAGGAEVGGGANGAKDHVAIDGGVLGVFDHEIERLDIFFRTEVIEAIGAGVAADGAGGDIELPGNDAGANPVDEIVFDGAAIGMVADGAHGGVMRG